MNGVEYMRDVWASRLSYYQGLTQKRLGLSDAPVMPKGFPGSFTQASWADFIATQLNQRVLFLKNTQEPVSLLYAANTEDALALWRRTGGPALPSAFDQLTAALDALILESAGLDAVAGMVDWIRSYLGATVPFPAVPPLESRTRLESWPLRRVARFLAVEVVLLPYVQSVQGKFGITGTTIIGDAYARAAEDAGIVETLAALILALAPDAKKPATALDTMRLLDRALALQDRPDLAVIPPSVWAAFNVIKAQVSELLTPLDQALLLPERAERAFEETKEAVGEGFTAVGIGLVVVAAAGLALALRRGDSTPAGVAETRTTR